MKVVKARRGRVRAARTVMARGPCKEEEARPVAGDSVVVPATEAITDAEDRAAGHRVTIRLMVMTTKALTTHRYIFVGMNKLILRDIHRMLGLKLNIASSLDPLSNFIESA